MTTWFTADHHFGHVNAITYCDRPFSSILEMDYVLIKRWNELIKPDDKVYHLGDFTLGNFDQYTHYRDQLNGNISIIQGNHDHRWFKPFDVTESVRQLVTTKLNGKYFILCHYAMRVWNMSHYGSYHLYGHSHGRLLPSEWDDKSMDVGVDCHNFYPISLEQVLEYLT